MHGRKVRGLKGIHPTLHLRCKFSPAPPPPPPPRRTVRAMLVHLGYPKTASTLLQRRVFDAAAGAGCCAPWSRLDPMTPGRSHVARRWTELGADRQAALDELRRGLDEADAKRLVPVLSEETLVGYIGNPTADLDRLARLFDLLDALDPPGGVRVLLCIREQRAMIRSAYAQSIVDGATSDLQTFLHGPRLRRRFVDHRQIGTDYLRYDQPIDWLQARVGRAAVTVLPLEMLRDDTEWFAKTLSDCLGVEIPVGRLRATDRVNARPGPGVLELLRRTNRFWPRRSPYELRWLRARLLPVRLAGRLLPTGSQELTHARLDAEAFADANRHAASIAGLPLQSLGYATSAETPAPPA